MVVTALAAGAVAGLKPNTEKAVKDSYQDLKTIIQDRYNIHIEALEKKPDSFAQREAVKEQMAETSAGSDLEVLDKATVLVLALGKLAPTVGETIGVKLVDVQAGLVKFRNIWAQSGSTGVHIERGTYNTLQFEDVGNGIDLKNV